MMVDKYREIANTLDRFGLCLPHILENHTPTSQGTEGEVHNAAARKPLALKCHNVIMCLPIVSYCILPFLRWFQRLQLH